MDQEPGGPGRAALRTADLGHGVHRACAWRVWGVLPGRQRRLRVERCSRPPQRSGPSSETQSPYSARRGVGGRGHRTGFRLCCRQLGCGSPVVWADLSRAGRRIHPVDGVVFAVAQARRDSRRHRHRQRVCHPSQCRGSRGQRHRVAVAHDMYVHAVSVSGVRQTALRADCTTQSQRSHRSPSIPATLLAGVAHAVAEYFGGHHAGHIPAVYHGSGHQDRVRQIPPAVHISFGRVRRIPLCHDDWDRERVRSNRVDIAGSHAADRDRVVDVDQHSHYSF